MKILFIVVLALLLQSCQNRTQKHIADIMSQWVDKEILFPNDLVYVSCMDTINVDIKSSCLKIITYTSAEGCVGCQLKLNEWERFIEEINTISNHNILVVKYLTPKRRNEAFFEIKQANYKYPVCIDINGEIENVNHFPSEKAFRSFLLDENNKVIIIGDPLQFPSIKDLYIRTICEYLGIERPKESVEPQRTTNSLGVFNWQTEQHTSFVVNNDKEEPMHIDSLYTSCECTTASIDKVDIAPHEKARVSVTFKADKPEQFMREIYADISGGDQIVMVIEGEAIE